MSEQATEARSQAQQRAEEAARAAEQARADAQRAQSVTSEYESRIKQVLKNNWFVPPAANQQMEAVLRISLLPTGELASVELVSGSGSAAFDNSALSAVRKVNRFPVPEDARIFNRSFRQFTITFNPETLR